MRTAPPAAAPQADARAKDPLLPGAWWRDRKGALAVITIAAALGGGLAAAGALSGSVPAPRSVPGPASVPGRHAPLAAQAGTVTGYIDACTGLGLALPYAAGTVTALPGQVTWVPAGAGTSRPRFPAVVAARQHVGQDQRFSFQLAPGDYVLVGHYDAGNTTTYVDVAVVAGQVLQRDLPNLCK